MATQAREGIVTTRAQAEAAYDKVQADKKNFEMNCCNDTVGSVLFGYGKH
jgi:hypothetical protein